MPDSTRPSWGGPTWGEQGYELERQRRLLRAQQQSYGSYESYGSRVSGRDLLHGLYDRLVMIVQAVAILVLITLVGFFVDWLR